MDLTNERSLALRHQQILGKIISYCYPGQKVPELLAVSKGQHADLIREAFALGQQRFGENYAQELVEKASTLSDLAIEWVYIGHIQSNKIKKIVSVASEIQTVSSLRHAELIEKAAIEFRKIPFPIYLEVNAGNEESKTGVVASSVLELASSIRITCPNLTIKGIMSIPPSEFQDETCISVPALYTELRSLAHRIGEGKLSLGMSGDLRIAIEAGTDLVRIGTALFGPRMP